MSKESGGNWFRGPFSLAGPRRRSDRPPRNLFVQVAEKEVSHVKDEGARAFSDATVSAEGSERSQAGEGLCINGAQSRSLCPQTLPAGTGPVSGWQAGERGPRGASAAASPPTRGSPQTDRSGGRGAGVTSLRLPLPPGPRPPPYPVSGEGPLAAHRGAETFWPVGAWLDPGDAP